MKIPKILFTESQSTKFIYNHSPWSTISSVNIIKLKKDLFSVDINLEYSPQALQLTHFLRHKKILTIVYHKLIEHL